MNLNTLSDTELSRNLRAIQEAAGAGEKDRLQALIQDLEVHQIELEMNNRALREAQALLESSAGRYADLYDNLPLAYMTVTVTGLIAACNRAAVEFLRADKRGLVGRTLTQYVDAYDAGRLAAHLEHCVQAGSTSSIELTLRPKGLDPVTVQISSRPAPDANRHEHKVHLAVTDISKLKRTQKILEDIIREQEAFNYSISHDLRAPLVTISNYANIVLSDHAAELSEEGRNMVQRMQCAAGRMELTLKNLLEYSTLGREEVVFESVSVDRVISDLLIEHRGVIHDRKAEVTVDRPLPNVRGSAVILNQVCANLLTNALKYTEEDKVPHIRFCAEARDTSVLLRVIDDGIGIDPKFHERIFRIFERLHGYSRYPGSGVGLAIARRAVERMNGRIWVESEPGKGSCFCVELPRG